MGKILKISFFLCLLITLQVQGELICFEAENANVIYPNMEVIPDKKASGGYCLGIREFAGSQNALDVKIGQDISGSIYEVNISKSGDYKLELKTFWEDGCGNSFWVEVDQNRLYKVADNITEEWHWLKGGSYHLEKGRHKILISEREDGVYLDQIALYSNDNPIDFKNNPPEANYLPVPIKKLPAITAALSSNTKLIENGKPVKLLLWLRSNREIEVNGTLSVNAKFAKACLDTLKFSLTPDKPVKIIPIELTYPEHTPSRQHPVKVSIDSDEKLINTCEINLEKPFKWNVVGPFKFQRKQENAINPDLMSDHSLKYQGKDGQVEWKQYPDDKLFNSAGFADFNKLFGETSMATVFLYTVIDSEKEQQLNMYILCDDTCELWLNRKLVAEKSSSGPAVRGPVLKQVQLQQGENIILAKVNQLKGYWNFKLFFTELDGKPCETINGLR